MTTSSDQPTRLKLGKPIGSPPHFIFSWPLLFLVFFPPLFIVTTTLDYFCAEKKCHLYMRENLRVPTWKLMLQWGRQLSMKKPDIQHVSDRLSLRHALGYPFVFSMVTLYYDYYDTSLSNSYRT